MRQNILWKKVGMAVFVMTFLFMASVIPAVMGQTDTWVVLENVGIDNTLNHNWTESNYTEWSVVNDTTYEEVYAFNTSTHMFGWALVNDTTINRSQAVMWAYTNDSNVYMGPIIAYNSTTTWAITILYGADSAGVCVFNTSNNTLWDLQSGVNLTDGNTTNMTNMWEAGWGDTCPHDTLGIWIKEIYNRYTGHWMTKAWAPFGEEKEAWDIDNTTVHGVADIPVSKGLFVWNPGTENITAYWDNYCLYNLTYELNATGVPEMEFPAIDAATLYTYYIAMMADPGNLTIDDAADILRSFYNFFNTESHIWYNDTNSDQYDNIYYYSLCVYNVSTFIEELFDLPEGASGLPASVLIIHIMDCTDGDDEYLDAARVWIDVDNDHSWDDNDRMYWWGGNVTDNWGYQYNGTDLSSVVYADYIANYPSAPDANFYHRYSAYKHYQIVIPGDALVKDDGTYLNDTDIFGLHIDISHNNTKDVVPIWENWNETANTSRYGFDSTNFTGTWYPNTHYDDLVIVVEEPDAENMSRWGIGFIGTGDGGFEGMLMDGTVTKNADAELYAKGTIVNFTIVITNTGDVNLTNVTLVETYGSYLVFYDSNIDAANITVTNTTFNVTDSLGVGESITVYIECRVSNDSYQGQYLTNTIVVTSDEGLNETATETIRVSGYDEITTTLLNDILPLLVGILLMLVIVGLGISGNLTRESAITMLIAVVVGMSVLLVITNL